ncbi:hypothetical protein [Aliidiomarina soli]|uniref:Uncharacterized protein n=1 Tax=Aliidiomarina soli TaxID=1928574 RepID=A0A432WM44_9GAMM|nr:hypothetical protein [Aliidiomarina soli]RUO34892.1 hypothetical protein CWE14_02525 [Aliidiomarina soli]
MNNFFRCLIAVVVYTIISQVTGVYHNVLTDPFVLKDFLLDLALFVAVFYVVWWITGKTRLGPQASKT